MEEKIRAAYEQMNPTPEQEERMLAALLQAQEQAAAEGGPMASEQMKTPNDDSGEKTSARETAMDGVAGATEAEQAMSSANDPAKSTAEPRRKRFSAWKALLPVAACLVVGAVLIGIGSQVGAPNAQAPLRESVASSSQPTNDSKSNVEALTSKPNDAAASGANAKTTEEVEAYEQDVDVVEINGAADGLSYLGPTEEPIPDIEEGPAFNTEEYAAIDENGFTATRVNPLSTVSADVDTASYANLRRMVNDGYRLGSIPSGAVRIEEMLNYFTYDYAKPTGDDLFSMQARVAACPWNPDTQLLVMGFATPAETAAAQKGANLVFLIDVSGSMSGNDKLGLLQDSFATLLEHLDSNDRVSIVTYSGNEEVVLEGAQGDDTARILKAIYRLHADGSTNGEAGLRMAYDVASRNFIDGGVNRIIMASDGDLNVGITSESDLYDLVEEKRDTGVYLSVLGFGSGNYKDTKMEVLADHGNGSYHYIDCIDEAERVFNERLLANLVPFADDVKVQVEFNPGQVKAYRLIGYENRALAAEDFLDDAVDAGDVGPNAQFTVAYEIVPADSAYEVNVPDLKYGEAPAASTGADSDEWLTCSLRYRAFSDDAVHQQSLAVSDADAAGNPGDDWRFASAVIEFGMIASGSDHVGTATLGGVLETLRALPQTPERTGFLQLVERLA